MTVAAHAIPQPIPLNLTQVPASIPPPQYVTTPQVPPAHLPQTVPLISSVHQTAQPMMLNVLAAGAVGSVDLATPSVYAPPQLGEVTSPPIGGISGSVSAQNMAVRAPNPVVGGQFHNSDDTSHSNAGHVVKMAENVKQVLDRCVSDFINDEE